MPPAVTTGLSSPCCTQPPELHICQLPMCTQHSQQKAAAPSPAHTTGQTDPYLAGLRAPQPLPPPPPPPCPLAAHLEVASSPGPQAPTQCHNTANTLMRADRPQGQACASALMWGCHPPWAESCTFGMGSTCCSPTRLCAGRGEHQAGPTASEQHPDHNLGHAWRSRQALGPREQGSAVLDIPAPASTTAQAHALHCPRWPTADKSTWKSCKHRAAFWAPPALQPQHPALCPHLHPDRSQGFFPVVPKNPLHQAGTAGEHRRRERQDPGQTAGQSPWSRALEELPSPTAELHSQNGKHGAGWQRVPLSCHNPTR